MKIVEQINTNECGVCVITSLFNHFNKKKINKTQILDDSEITNSGMSIIQFENLASKYGIDCDSYEMNSDEFKATKIDDFFVTIINKNNLQHYIIARKNKKEVEIYDSSSGVYSLSTKEFIKIFSGIIIFVEKVFLNVEIKKYNKSYFKNINIKYILIVNIFNIINIFLSVFIGTFIQAIIDKSLNNESITNLLTLSIIYIIAIILNKISEYFLNLFMSDDVLKKYNYMLNNVYKKIPNKKFDFYDKIDNNYLINLQDIIYDLASFYSMNLNKIVADILSIIIGTIVLSIINLLFLLVLILIIISSIIFSLVQLNFSKENISKMQDLSNSSFKSWNEYILFNRSNHNSNNTNSKITTLESLFSIQKKESKNIIKFSSNIAFINSILKSIIYVFIVFIGIYTMIINNETNIGSLIFSISLIQLVSGSVDGFLSLINDIPIYKVNNNIYNDILHISNINENDINIEIKSKINKIKYENVNFRNIITNFNSTIHNDTLLFGKSGIGKSTIVKMLTKKYDVDSGNIYLNEIDLKNISNSWISKNIIYMSINNAINIEKIDKVFQSEYSEIVIKTIKDMKLNIGDLNIEKMSPGVKQIFNFIFLILFEDKVIILDEVLNNVDSFRKEILMNNIKPIIIKNNFLIWISHDQFMHNFFRDTLEIYE